MKLEFGMAEFTIDATLFIGSAPLTGTEDGDSHAPKQD
jgi:hypothetical protein